jgi:hypothetical protein
MHKYLVVIKCQCTWVHFQNFVHKFLGILQRYPQSRKDCSFDCMADGTSEFLFMILCDLFSCQLPYQAF